MATHIQPDRSTRRSGTAAERLLALYRCGCCIALLLAGPVAGQLYFAAATDEPITTPQEGVQSTAIGDYDNDGWPDLLLVEIDGPIALWHNEGDGRFVDRTLALPADLSTKKKGGGGGFGDYDNDGDLDLFFTVGAIDFFQRDLNILLRNDRGLFTNVAGEVGLPDEVASNNAIWLDYDRNGDLDLYVGNVAGGRNQLYRNNGDGTFTDVTGAAGLDISLVSGGGSYGGMVAGDFNDDGWPDLYLGVLGASNRLFINDARGGFRDATTNEIGDVGSAIGVAVGDIDRDGDLDIFQNTFRSAYVIGDIHSPINSQGPFQPLMLLNLGEGRFLNVLEGVGLAELIGKDNGSPGLADIDNDGDLDLLFTWNQVADAPGGSAQASSYLGHFALFLNNGDGTFVERSARAGIPGPSPEPSPSFLCFSFGDYDLDGFLDLWSSRGILFRNAGNSNHWLRVELAGRESNRNGIGARLRASSGDLRQMREMFGGNGISQDELVAHFGLGTHTRVDSLEILWPSGQVDVLRVIAADQKIRVFEGRDDYHVVEPAVWESAPPGTLKVGASVDLELAVRPAQFDAGARIIRVAADLSALGGPSDLQLADRGNGIYGREISFRMDATHGAGAVTVRIEQETLLGPRWTNLTKTIVVAPVEDLAIFTDVIEARWMLDNLQSANLSFHPANDGGPAWSPDGTQIAFESEREGNFEIYLMAADGTHPVKLTHHPAGDGGPVWSPDGTKLAFHSNREGNWEVYVMDVDGSHLVKLTHNPADDTSPAWSPDGTQIAFHSNREDNWEVYVMDADDSNPLNLTRNPEAVDRGPAWSPDGKKIAFQSRQEDNIEVYVMDADGSNPLNLTRHPAVDQVPVWSPDGTKLAFHTNRDDNWEVYAIAANGNDLVELRQESEIVYRGDQALALRTEGVWRLPYVLDTPLNIVGYDALHFAFRPGAVTASDKNAFNVTIGQESVDLVESMGIDLQTKDWQVVEVPLAAFKVFRLSRPLEAIHFSGHIKGAFFLDDIRLVPAITAVLEEQISTVPRIFALEQNFPNPFNSGTAIRFALPADGEVELVLYNLMGQKVATLVEGLRAAGIYAIHWDGVNERGRALASGVYLYRLRAGAQVETRKLVVLR
jgi:Tol biopolymer transport system component